MPIFQLVQSSGDFGSLRGGACLCGCTIARLGPNDATPDARYEQGARQNSLGISWLYDLHVLLRSLRLLDLSNRVRCLARLVGVLGTVLRRFGRLYYLYPPWNWPGISIGFILVAVVLFLWRRVFSALIVSPSLQNAR